MARFSVECCITLHLLRRLLLKIVKERGRFRQNAFPASTRSFPDFRVAPDFVPGRGIGLLRFCFQAIMGN
jgi:hypothetical protein